MVVWNGFTLGMLWIRICLYRLLKFGSGFWLSLNPIRHPCKTNIDKQYNKHPYKQTNTPSNTPPNNKHTPQQTNKQTNKQTHA